MTARETRFDRGDRVELPRELWVGQDGREGVVVASWWTTFSDRENFQMCLVNRTLGGRTRATSVREDELYRLGSRGGGSTQEATMATKGKDAQGAARGAAKATRGAAAAVRGRQAKATMKKGSAPRAGGKPSGSQPKAARKPRAAAPPKAAARVPSEYGLKALMQRLRETGECRVPEEMDPRRFRAWNAAKKAAAELGVEYLGTSVEDGHVVARIGTKA